jgi:type I restriction-modification system DNA methylase subunit
MNLALHGLSRDIRLANSYYEDPHDSVGKFDFVMANPPFNVDKVDKNKLAGDHRFPFGLPKLDNANYLWNPALLCRAQRQRARRICHGQLRSRCWPFRT